MLLVTNLRPMSVSNTSKLFMLSPVKNYLQPQRLLAARPLSPFQLLDLAQNDLCLGPDLVGAFKLLPVLRLYLARPLAVNPPFLETDCFSPRPTERLGLSDIRSRALFVDNQRLFSWLIFKMIRHRNMSPTIKFTNNLVIFKF